MPRAEDCIPVVEACNFADTEKENAYLFEVLKVVNQLLGSPNNHRLYGYWRSQGFTLVGRGKIKKKIKTRGTKEEALAAHKRMHKQLVDFLMENGRISNGDIKPDHKIEGLLDYLHAHLGSAREGASLLSNPSTVLTTEKLLDRLIKRDIERTEDIAPEQRGYWKRMERAVMPVIFSGMNDDRFGLYNRFIKSAISLTERVRSTRAPYTDRLIHANGAFQNFMESTIGRKLAQSELGTEYLMDGIVIESNRAGVGKVLYLGDRDGIDPDVGYKESLVVLKNGERGYFPSTDFDRGEIRLSLNAKYRDEFGSKVQDGTARHVVFIDNDKVPTKDISLPREYGKASTGAEAHGIIGILNEMKRKGEMGESSGRVHTKQSGQYIYSYVMIKQGERTGGPEVYNAYIVSHQRADKKEPPVYYFDTGYNKRISGKKIEERAGLHKASEIDALESGWYESSGWETHGEILSSRSNYNKETKKRERRAIRYSVDKQPNFSNMSPMENPPHPSILEGQSLEADISSMNFWEHLNEKRDIVKKFFEEVVQPQANNNNLRLRNVMPKFMDVVKTLDMERKAQVMDMMDKEENYTPEELAIIEAKEAEESLQTFLEAYNAQLRISINRWGLINSSNMYAYPKQENYFPWMWRDTVVMDMLHKAVQSIELRKENTPNLTEEDEIIYDEQIDTFNQLIQAVKIKSRETNKEMDGGATSRIHVGAKAAMLKHRKGWTDVDRVRRDGDVLKEYIQNTMYSLLKEELVVDALETIVEMKSLGEKVPYTAEDKAEGRIPKGKKVGDIKYGVGKDFYRGHVDAIINRLKYALNDPTATAGLPLPGGRTWNYGYQRMADFFNKYPLVFGKATEERPVRHTADSVAKLVTFLRGVTTSIFLGASGAMTNRTQGINPLVAHGIRTFSEAMDILKNLDSTANQQWKAIIQAVGTDELVQAFNDAVGSSEETDLTDAGFLQIPIPFVGFVPTTNFFRLMRMVQSDKEDWIKNGGIPKLDEYLNKIELQRIKSWRDMKKILKDKKVPAKVRLQVVGMKGPVGWYTGGTLKDIEKEIAKAEKKGSLLKKRAMSEIREIYLDLLLTPKDQNTEEILEAKFQNLMGYVTDNRLKLMVSWKLTFWYGELAKYFTYTEGEKFMRRHGVIMELLEADRRGHLGGDKDIEQITVQEKDPRTGQQVDRIVDVESRFLTDKAKGIARRAVRNQFFGMTKVHMGEALGGGGDSIWQYKGYNIQQQWHDYRYSSTLWRGGMEDNGFDSASRVKDQMEMMIAEAAHLKAPYNANDPDADPEARAYARLLLSRHVMSLMWSLTEALGPLRLFLSKAPSFNIFKGAVRGGENPSLAFAYRILVRTALLMALEDEKKVLWGLGQAMSTFLRLFLPLWVTYWPQTFYRGIKTKYF